MIDLIREYKNHLDNIPNLIEKSDYKTSYFLKHLNLKPATYYRKLRLKSFTTSEIEILTKLLRPKKQTSSNI